MYVLSMENAYKLRMGLCVPDWGGLQCHTLNLAGAISPTPFANTVSHSAPLYINHLDPQNFLCFSQFDSMSAVKAWFKSKFEVLDIHQARNTKRRWSS